VSSCAVYGKQPSEITQIPETYQGSLSADDPTHAYAEGKRVADELVGAFHKEHGIQATIVRCFTFVGPGLPPDAHFAIGNFIRDSMRGKSIRVKDGTPCRSYLYAVNLAVWLWSILF